MKLKTSTKKGINKKKINNKKSGEVKLSRVFYHYWKFARKYKWQYLIVQVSHIIGSVLLFVVNPLFYKKIINFMNNGVEFDRIWSIFLLIVVMVVLANIFFRISEFFMTNYQSRGMRDLSNYIFEKIIRHATSFFENSFTGSLVNKSSKFIVAYERILDIFVYNLFFAFGQIVIILIIMFSVNNKIASIFLGWFIGYVLISIFFTKRKMIFSYNLSKEITIRTGVLADAVTNVLNIKIFSSSRREGKYYKKFVNRSWVAMLKSWQWNNIQLLINSILFLILEFLTVGTALKLWNQGIVTIGDVVLVQAYYGQFFVLLWSLSRVLKDLITAISDAKEMVEILDQEIEVRDIKNAKKLKVNNGEIVFKDSTFAYPNQKEEVFNKFNLTIPAGQTLGLVGTSGAGKTTITKLLLRFANLKSGKILVDDQDIARITQDSLREAIAYVPQEPVLFHRSIYENIAYANPKATKKEVMKASKKAHVDEFVQTLEAGYDTMVGERGVKLSGGQKQRVAIARAFLKNAPILVLDEATSALDSISEELIQDALFKLMKNKTVIVVAHRLSTIQRLERILVIEDGEIKEDGNHQELLHLKGLYQKFWQKQTERFE